MINKIFNTTFGIIVVLIILLNIIYAPPRFVKADKKPIEIETEDKETNIAFLTWEQESWNLLETFYFFPSKRQLCLYNEELDLKWELEEYPNITSPEVLPMPFTIPIWKYWLATISLILGFIPIYLVYILKSYYNYKVAKKLNTFRSYKNYLLRLMLPNFLRKKAGSKLKTKIGSYKDFLKVVTYKTSGELKEVLFKTIESIEETGNVKVKLQVEFENNCIPQKEYLQKYIDYIDKHINQLSDKNSFTKLKKTFIQEAEKKNKSKELEILKTKIVSADDYKKMFDLKKEALTKRLSYQYVDLKESFDKSKNIDRKYLYAEYLNELFKVIFPEQIINIEIDATSLITFHLNSSIDNRETFEFWKEDEGKLLKDIILLPDIKYNWEFYVTIKHLDPSKKEYISSKITSTTSYPLYTKNNVVEDYYMFITKSAFVNFTRDIAKAFGMKKDSNTQNDGSVNSVDLFLVFENKLSEFLLDQSEEIPTSLLEEFYGDYESSLDGLLIDDDVLDLLFEGLEGVISTAKEFYESMDFIKETIQDS